MNKEVRKARLMSFKKDFFAFAMKGNVVDMAVGVVVGGAFNAIVTSLVNDIIFPLLSPMTGRLDYTNLFIAMDGRHYDTLEAAKAAGTATLQYGNFLSVVVNFLIVALSIYFVVRILGKLRTKQREPAAGAPTVKTCPYCKSKIDVLAVRCPYCTSDLNI